MMFPMLDATNIDVRVAMIKETGCQLLLYKNARADMDILDATVGAENWQRKHYECKGNLFCSVGIKIDDDWIWKDDCGSESNVEKEKGEASDSFKRACFNWGIGRELYTAPFIWIKSDKISGKYDKFHVEKIAYNSNKISGIAILNDTTKQRVFVWKDEAS